MRYTEIDMFDWFKGMFDSRYEANATEELFQSLKDSKTAAHSYETCHFVRMETGDMWIFRFAPSDGDAWKIYAIQKLSEEEAKTIGSLLWGPG
jgi:hypothetical protein